MTIEKVKSLDSSVGASLLKLRKDTLGYIPAMLIPAFINFLSIFIYTRIFSASDYGEYSLVIVVATITTILLSQWVIQSLQRYRPEYKNSGKLIIFNSNLIKLVLSIALLFLLISVSFYYIVISFFPVLKEYYVIISVFIFTQLFYLIGISILQSDTKVKEYRNFQMAASILKFGITIGWIYLINFSIEGLIYGAILSNILLMVPLILRLELRDGRRNDINADDEIETFKLFMVKFLRFGVPMIGWFLATSLLDLSDRFILQLFRDSTEVGIYAAIYGLIASLFSLMTFPLLAAAHPIIMRATSIDEVMELKERFTKIYLHVVTPISGLAILFHKEICGLFLGPEFTKGSSIIPILLIGFYVWNLSMFGHKGHEFKEKTNVMLLFVGISAVVNIALNFLLIPSMGYQGAAISTTVGFFSYTFLIYLSSKKYVLWKISRFMFMKIIINTIISISIVYLLKLMVVDIHIIVLLGVGGSVYSFIYIMGLLLFKEINKQQFSQFKKLLVTRGRS